MAAYYETAGHAIAAGLVLSIVDIIIVALKFWTRIIRTQPLKADDWFLVPATLFTTGIGIVLAYGATHKAIGWPLDVPSDYHGDISLLTSDQITLSRKIQYAFILMFPLALGSTKVSFLFLYKRIFSIGRKTRMLLTIMIIIVFLWTIIFFFIELFQCTTKFWANWGSTHDIRTQCLKTTKMAFALCLTDFLIDLAIIVTPVPLVWQLSLTTKRKLGVISIFLLGAITVAASLVRLIVVIGLVFSAQDASAKHRLVGVTTSLYWGMVESSIGILVACLLTIQVLFRKGRWKRVFGGAPSSPSLGAVIPTSRSFRSKSSAARVIHVDYAVDVEYSIADNNPILTRAEPWIRNDGSDDNGSEGFELQQNRPWHSDTEQRPAYPVKLKHSVPSKEFG